MPHLCKISSSYLVSVPNYWTWTKITPQKKPFFWSNPYKIELMINPRNARVTTKLWSHDHIYNIIWITIKFCRWRHGHKLDVITFFQIFILRRPGVAIFADTPKWQLFFIKTIFIDSHEKLKELEVLHQNAICSLYMYFLI